MWKATFILFFFSPTVTFMEKVRENNESDVQNLEANIITITVFNIFSNS